MVTMPLEATVGAGGAQPVDHAKYSVSAAASAAAASAIPGLMTTAGAVRHMLDGLARDAAVTTMPLWVLTFVNLVHAAPPAVYDILMRNNFAGGLLWGHLKTDAEVSPTPRLPVAAAVEAGQAPAVAAAPPDAGAAAAAPAAVPRKRQLSRPPARHVATTPAAEPTSPQQLVAGVLEYAGARTGSPVVRGRRTA